MAGTPFHYQVQLRGINFEDFHMTGLITGTINVSTDIGKAVAVDANAAASFKLAGDDDLIVGRLVSYEDRTAEGIKVGTIAFKFSDLLPLADPPNTTVVVGSTVVGAGNGEVKKAAADDPNVNFVSAIVGTSAVVTKL